MKTRSDFQALLPYFQPEAQQVIRSAALPHLAALQLFDVSYAVSRLQETSSEDLESASTSLKKNVQDFMFEHVPAYKKYHAESGDQPIDKSNYLRAYPLNELVADESDTKLISLSSGSSGKPYFWPRGSYLELETAVIYEIMLEEGFQISKKHTLLIDAYAMGTWVAGVFTLNSCLKIAERGYPLTIMTPGSNSEEVLTILQEIGRNYDQVIICGYPPLVKDILEIGANRGIDWSEFTLRFIFGAEAISEAWRSHLYKIARVSDYYHGSMNTYGTADMAIIGHETPLSILIKRLAESNQGLMERLFDNRQVCTLVQYHPETKHCETQEDELLCTTFGGLPVYRYNIHDNAKVLPFTQLKDLLAECGLDLEKEAAEAGIHLLHLPFIVLFGKSDQTVTLSGAKIFPQHVRSALEKPELIDLLTARMSMVTLFNENQDQCVEVRAELRPNIKPTEVLSRTVLNVLHTTLLAVNTEYTYISEKTGDPRLGRLRVVLMPYGTITADISKKQPWIVQ